VRDPSGEESCGGAGLAAARILICGNVRGNELPPARHSIGMSLPPQCPASQHRNY
jgi:hypothetical protein